ncbi:MAG: hypothetical protein PUB75_06130 [Firmicutes bacterium]|nr:hypothetical protein [Bacillota bacterium]
MDLIKRIIITTVILIFGAVSFFGLSKWAENPETYNGTTAKIEELQNNAIGLTTAATGTATLAAAVPGDATTPVANKLADVAGYMVIVYAALTTEKYIMVLAGALLFKIAIPLAAVVVSALIIAGKTETRWTYIVLRVLAVFIVLWALVPASMYISTKVQDIYETTARTKLEQVDKENKQIEKEAEAEKKANNKKSSNLFDKIYEKVKNVTVDAKSTAKQKAKEFETALDNMIEGVAIMIVTTCVIPFIVMAILLWVAKLIVIPDAQFRIPRLPKASKYLKRQKERINDTE